MDRLMAFGMMAKNHWEKYRPKMVAELKRRGVYQEALIMAQETAKKVLANRMMATDRTGMALEVARKEVLEEFILLPDEKEVPTLSPDRMPWL